MKSILRSSGTRRDSVPGFTMAEIMILIIFVLLLLLLINNEIKEEDPPPAPTYPSDIGWESTKLKADQLDSILAFAGENDIEPNLKGVLGAIEDADKLKTITDAADGLGIPPTSEEIIKVLEKGTGRPSCWRSEIKKFIYIFEVSLHEEYFVVRDKDYGAYSGEKYIKPVPYSDIPFEDMMSPNEFSSILGRPFLDWSVKQDPECRFYVIVHDETAPTAKVLWKKNLRTLEDYFYKLEKRSP